MTSLTSEKEITKTWSTELKRIWKVSMFVNNMCKQYAEAIERVQTQTKYKQAWAEEYQALPDKKMHRIVSV